MSSNVNRWAAVALLTAGLFGLTRASRADLLGFWDFNTENPPEASVALDQSGKGNHGVITGSVYTADKGGYTGQAGDKALTFDGGGDTITVRRALSGFFDSIGTNQKLTVAFWQFGSDDQPLNQSQFWANGAAQDRAFQAHVPWSDNNVYFDTGGCCAGTQRLNGVADPSQFTGAWNHWVFIKDGGAKRIYSNGTLFLEDLEADQTAVMAAPRGGLWLGSATDGTSSSKGEYDDFAIWDEALTDAQITTLYDQGVRAVEPGLPTVNSYTPVQPVGRLVLGAGNKIQGAAYLADPGTGDPIPGENPRWDLRLLYKNTLTPAGDTYGDGLATEWIDGQNLASVAAWNANAPSPGVYRSTASVPTFPAFRVPTVSWGNDKSNGGVVTNEYPPVTGWTGVNHENYSVRFSGEIFVPAGTWTFRDHNDDYAYLAIDGEVLIDDNTWTSFDGTGDAAQPDVLTGAAGSFASALADQDHLGMKGHWYPVDFRGAEGGGGDNWRLLWDYSGANQSSPDDPSVQFSDFNTVDDAFFRSKLPGVAIEFEVPLGSAAFDPPFGPAGITQLGDKTTNAELGVGLGVGQTGTYRLYVADTVLGRTSVTEATFTGVGGGTIPGDIDGNGKVDLTDFGILKENFGKSGGAAVPEPSSFVLAGLGLLGLGWAGIRRRKG